MAFAKYRATVPVDLPDRTWPDKRFTAAPRWCSVDLRDGNQALIDPMDLERKTVMFLHLVEMALRRSRSVFLRPRSRTLTSFETSSKRTSSLTIQVLTQCREDLIRRTYESLHGAKRAIVHFYNSHLHAAGACGFWPRQRRNQEDRDRRRGLLPHVGVDVA